MKTIKIQRDTAAYVLAEAVRLHEPPTGEKPYKRSGVRKVPRSKRTHGLKFAALLQHRSMKEWAYKPGTMFKLAQKPLRTRATKDERRLIELRLNPPPSSAEMRMTPRQVARALGLTTKAVLKAPKLGRRA